MPSGQIPSNPLEFCQAHALLSYLSELKAQYDHIIVDTPLTQAVSDALVIAKC